MPSMVSVQSSDRPRFGELLREFRVAQGLSQEELAERAAMSVNGISALERGANQSPQRKTLELIVRALDLRAEQQRALEAAAARSSRPRVISNEDTVAVDGLPRASTPIFGRDDDVVNVIKLIEDTALVTLTGAGGIGKTRLALCIAEKLANRFPGAVQFVDLAPLRDDESVSCAIESHSESLRSQPALIVVDNCEHLAPAAARAIAALLQRSPRVRILATSRQSLGVPGEQLYLVGPLSLHAAIELFAERAKRATGAFTVSKENHDAIASICSHLDGLALAIELAAARTKLLTLAELETRLSERFHLLAGGSELMVPRQQTMRATLDWSYRLLSEREQQALMALAVFPGSFSLDAALHICNDGAGSEWEVLEALQSLVDKSLINCEGCGEVTRYRMLDTTRAYLTDCMVDAGDRRTIRRRHLHYYAKLAEQAQVSLAATSSTSGWSRALEPDFENFLAALDWSLGEGDDVETGARILCSLQEFWMVQGFAADAARRAQEALQFQTLSRTTQGRLWLTIARMRQELFVHPEEALDAARRAEQLLEGSAERDGLALALRQQGAAHIRLRGYDEAHNEFERSLEIYRELGDQRMIARGLGYIASLLQVQGEFARARTTLLDVLELVRAIGDDRMIPTVAMNLAEAEFALGDACSAANRAAENLSNEDLRKSCEMVATQESNLSAYLLALGRVEEARAMALASIDDASGSFPAVPLQHFAATIAESQPRSRRVF